TIPPASFLGSNVALRLFDSNGTQIAGALDTTHNALTVSGLTANTTYYVGVSIASNIGYNANNPAAVTPGTTYGSYRLAINLSSALVEVNDTTSFTLSGSAATNVGTIGAAGFNFN